MIAVMIVDDHEMVRLGVQTFLNVNEHINVVAQASNGKEAIDLALALKPDVILMDLVMDKVDGVAATKAILKEWQTAKIIIVTSFIDDEAVYPAIEAGAYGYLLKTTSPMQIVDAIERVHLGEKIYTPDVLHKIQKGRPVEKHTELTARELEVLLLMANGQSNQEIAETLFLSIKTVKTHVSNVLMKLEVEDRTQAAVYAFKKGLMK